MSDEALTPGPPTFGEFEAFAKTQSGKVFWTLAQEKRFRFVYSPEAFFYTPFATGKQRPHRRHFVERVFARFVATRSPCPGDYRDISKNASYALALIDAYMQSRRAVGPATP
ncbi:MAG: hypothetical protein FJ291_33410 [Planctomycetes bacterium]|nr:hypothetical protein [Planctomycetota bacterium]